MIKSLLRQIFFPFVFLLLSQQAFCQLPAFALTVTKTDETCTANGTLNFTVSGTVTGSSVIYRIFRLPDVTTPISVLSANVFTGLVAGNYRVVATQSLGNDSSTQQRDITIDSRISILQFALEGQDEICGNDAKITVRVYGGTAASYSIIGGPLLRPEQLSNEFTSLIAGTYQVQVTDSCDQSFVRSFVISLRQAGLEFIFANTNISNCTTTQISCRVMAASNNIIAYPLIVTYAVHPPTGPDIVSTETIAIGGSNGITMDKIIPFFRDSDYSYTISITDRCANNYVFTRQVDRDISDNARLNLVGCDNAAFVLSPSNTVMPFRVNFLSGPANFNPLDFNQGHPGDFYDSVTYYNPTISFPSGEYSYSITDSCGRTKIFRAVIPPRVIPQNYEVTQAPGCLPGYGSCRFGSDILSGSIIQAPTGFEHALPFDISPYITNTGAVSMNSLPAGNYVFQTVGRCGSRNTQVNIIGYGNISSTYTVTKNCNSFNFVFSHTSNVLSNHFDLQKYNTEHDRWEYVNTVTPNVTMNNINATGLFRVIKYFRIFANGQGEEYCFDELFTFEYESNLTIHNVYSFECLDETYDVVVDASGVGDLRYRIVAKNNNVFTIDNGLSAIFLGLEPAVYTFEVKDICGATRLLDFDINNPVPFPITPVQLCSGHPASLTVPRFSFLTYKWWKNSDTATILSTTNQLNFPSFNPATDFGTYHVRVSYTGNPNSCIDFTLNYQISYAQTNPQSGTGQSVSYCGNQGTIDLFSLLIGPFDTHGNWEEITNSGSLSDNLWDSTTAVPGNYRFKYTVTGGCGASSEAIVNIALKAVPENPIPFLEQVVCDTQTIHLLATTVPDASYVWSGPNGFSSTQQNPIIENVTPANNGFYTVKAVANGCESANIALEIKVNTLPQVTVAKDCDGNQMMLTATVKADSFNPDTASYSWIGPENFTASGNPVNISGKPKGMYEVTVTSVEGCDANAQIAVPGTACMIPAGVSPNNDNRNDTFDLSGFDVVNLKIYSRYGRMVFEKDNYTNEWHGQDFNNRSLPDATYYYYVKMTTGEERTGWVYIIN